MRKTILSLCVLILASSIHAQERTELKPRYIAMTGTIGKYPVTVHLVCVNNIFSGWYYYHSTEHPMQIAGKLMNDSANLNLYHYENDETKQENWDGIYTDTVFSGIWSLREKKLPFRLTSIKDTSGLSFDYLWYCDVKDLRDKKKDPPNYFNYVAGTVWPAKNSRHPATDVVKQAIHFNFDEKKSTEDLNVCLARQLKATMDISRHNGQTPYSQVTYLTVAFHNPSLLTLAAYNARQYLPGHTSWGTTYFCIDLVHRKPITLGDVLDTAAMGVTLSRMLARHFKKTHDLRKDQSLRSILLQDKIPPTGNIALSSKGIGFNYRSAEIAASHQGEFYIYIPFGELDPWLMPAFKTLKNRKSIGMKDKSKK
jgi:hypothetical protein